MESNAIDLPFVGRWGPQGVVVQLKIRPEAEQSERKLPFRVYMLEGGGCVARGLGLPAFFPSWEALTFRTGARLDDYELDDLNAAERGCWDVRQFVSLRVAAPRPDWERRLLTERAEAYGGHETW